MKGGSVAKRYATALLLVAQEQNSLATIQRDLVSIIEVTRQNAALRQAMESPVVAPSQKKKIIGELQAKMQLHPAVHHLILVLIDQDRMDSLALLGMVFRDMADDALGQVRVLVRSAVPLGDQEALLKETLEKTLSKQVLLQTQVVPEILGGISIQVADKVFDGTLKAQLEHLKQSVVKRAVA